jgi:hypothetical protein
MEHILRLAAFLALLSAALTACRREADLERREKRALAESVSQAQDTVHKLNMKELGGAALSDEEVALRKKLKEQAEEDQNGGEGRPPETPEPAQE